MEEPLNDPDQHIRIKYEPVETEGQCILQSISPVRKIAQLYILYIVFCVIMLGIPIIIVYWYPKLKLFLYFTACNLRDCTHFYIVNYDNQISIVQRQQEPKEQHPSVSSQSFISQSSKRRDSDPIRSQRLNQDQNQIYFINRYMKYLITDGVVKASLYHYEKHIKSFVKKYTKLFYKQSDSKEKQKPKIQGHSQDQVLQLRKRYGIGTMQIERPTIGILFLREVVRPLYFFILFSIILWLHEYYYIYCTIIFLTSAIGIIANLYQTFKLNKKIHGMAYYQTQVNVLRGTQIIKKSSIELVPGDIVFLKQQIKMPFDGIILEGSALMNQCALTGQSVPIIKKSETIEKYIERDFNCKVSEIYEGTTLIQVNNQNKMKIFEDFREEFGIPVYVIRTNFVTVKGQLIRIISFPQQRQNIFYKQSSSFLIFLFLLAVVSYTFLVIKYSGLIQISDLIIKFLDLITITVPPGLPVSMTFGIIFAVEKMEKKDIYCVSPSKVISGGLVDFLCFDKTGTLTEDYMNLKYFVPSLNGKFYTHIENTILQQQQGTIAHHSIKKIIEEHPFILPALANMATNHSIVKVQNTGQYIGDPMEIKLFEFGQYKIESLVHEKLPMKEQGQLKESIFNFESSWGHRGQAYVRFDFDPELLRMSTLAETKCDFEENHDQTILYSKGSPEAMYKIFKPNTIPANYFETLKQYTGQGFRVLAIGHKPIDNLHLSRLEMQENLIFDGFQIFENCLKPQTKEAIKQLKNANLPCIMITGDNSLTGTSIGYKCKIADTTKKMYLYDYDEHRDKLSCEQFKYEPEPDEEIDMIEDMPDPDKNKQIQMAILSKKQQKNDIEEEKKYDELERELEQMIQNLIANKGQACMTGTAFNHLFVYSDTLSQNRKRLLENTSVFARTKPNDKAKIVMAYQNLGKKVAMCGDGANDCGALKQADIGLSLSQAEASISAPFTSKITNISSMVELIKQCRAGLVTNFSLFDIMCMYSFIQYSTDMIVQYMYSYPSDYQFVYWDIFGNFIFFMTFGYTGTANKLSKDKPSYVLLSFTNLLQIFVMFFTQLFGQLLMIYSLSNIFSDDIHYPQKGGPDNNYQRYIDGNNSYALDTPETNILFLFSNFMYIFTFLAFSFSKPWRKEFYTNKPFLVCFIVVFVFSSVLVIVPASRFHFFQLTYLQNNASLNLFIYFVALGISGLILFSQKVVLQPLSKWLRSRYPNKQWI